MSRPVLTRVRARLRSFQALAVKMDLRMQEEKTTQTVCLLSTGLLLPYLARSHAALVVAATGALAYSCLLLPMLLWASLQPPPARLFAAAARTCAKVLSPVFNLLKRAYRPLERMERAWSKMANISTMVNQLLFFLVCDRVLVPSQRLTCFYSLMFYNVIAYCVAYIKELLAKEDWSPYVTMAEHSNIKHLAMSATKIVLEWTKAVTFIITVVFMLLVFGLEQGLQHYHPTAVYTAITGLYYVATEKVFIDSFPTILARLQLDAFESLEALWAPVLLRGFTIALSATLALAAAARGHLRTALAALYLNVAVRMRETRDNSFRALQAERAAVARFRHATADELAAFDDVCAVCLCPMKRHARVTPCQHIFHGDCLRQCLKTSDHCPICKRELKFD